METPNKKVTFTPASKGETIDLAGITCRILEDGSTTDNRIGCAEFIVPPNTSGPPAHWHEMHDEVFLVTTGTIRFHLPGSTHIDATPGDHVVIPPKAPHAFSNPTDKEARFYDTFTPAFYINYFKLVAQMLKDEKEGKGALNKEKMTKAMAYFATMGVEGTL